MHLIMQECGRLPSLGEGHLLLTPFEKASKFFSLTSVSRLALNGSSRFTVAFSPMRLLGTAGRRKAAVLTAVFVHTAGMFLLVCRVFILQLCTVFFFPSFFFLLMPPYCGP